jgi:hypothetical protein
VVLDGAVAEIELRCDLGVGEPLGGEACDLRLLRGELVPGIRRPLANGFAGCGKFSSRPLREAWDAHLGEHLVGCP